MFQIHPIQCGQIDTTSQTPIYLPEELVEMTVPATSFLLVTDDPNDDTVIVVDTGVSEEIEGRELELGGPEPIRRGLANHGYSPRDVDYVILTHLHFDHASNNDLFPEAEFVLQESEYEAAKDPLPVLRWTYSDESIETLETMGVRLIDGKHRLMEGIELYHTPGHTEGMQSVLVQTESGRHALISDLAYCEYNLNPSVAHIEDARGVRVETSPSTADYMPPGTHTDVTACYDSIQQVRDLVENEGVLIPSHDHRIYDDGYID